jgi:hypothetical protein
MAASLFLPSGSQLCRKNRPLSSQHFITFFPGVVNTSQKKPNSLKFIDNDTAEKLFTTVHDTADKTMESFSYSIYTLQIIFRENIILYMYTATL